MPDIYQQARTFRAQLLARDQQAAVRMVDGYRVAYGRIKEGLDRLLEQIAEAKQAGVTVGPSWLFRRDRLESLLRQTREQMDGFARGSAADITAEQRSLVEVAERQAHQLALAGLGPPPTPGLTIGWNRLPTGALEHLVGTLGNGSPLTALLNKLGPDAAAGIRAALIGGVATGQGPRVTSRQIALHLGGNLVRALTIARTETLRSYREASLASYRANTDVVEGWIWVASLSGRTCAACLAMHGTWHPLDSPMGSHPNCRCTAIPATRTWAELGFEGGPPESKPAVEPGPDWFARQPEETQLRVLGAAKFAAYKSGEITLPDLVGYRDSPKWGPERWEKSLGAARDSNAA